MINSVFVAGTTVCYIIFKDPSLWTPARANDLRACSSTLFAAAERNGALQKYCDALETIIESVMEYVENMSITAETRMSDEDFASPSLFLGESEHPQTVFDKLRRTFKDLKFEFPSRSYPTYRVRSEQLSKEAPVHISSARSVMSGDVSERDHVNAKRDRNGRSENHWDIMEEFDGGVDIASTDYLFGGDQLAQQIVDDLLSKTPFQTTDDGNRVHYNGS
ncbi:hypothetical protein AK830_g10652 [Neonectria ditissima]|uniref:Uncharacterized protein n=1 Tax=Neonectria ditissima TaxID=78410 RepID=A0A0P7ASY6_9HYPO|nr:hypothetical protein AK830_g10652 [Neonectria ditissima]